MTMYDVDQYFWVEKKERMTRIGISAKGQEELGEIKFVDVPKDKLAFNEGETLIGIEASKAVTELAIPFTAELIAWNFQMIQDPEVLNDSDISKTWIADFRIQE